MTPAAVIALAPELRCTIASAAAVGPAFVTLMEVYDFPRRVAVAVGAEANAAPCPALSGTRARALRATTAAAPDRALVDAPSTKGVRATLTVRVPPDPLRDGSELFADMRARAEAAAAAVTAAVAPEAAAACALALSDPPFCGFLGSLAASSGMSQAALAGAMTSAVSAAALPSTRPALSGAASGGGGASPAGGDIASAVAGALAVIATLAYVAAARWRASHEAVKLGRGYVSPRTSPTRAAAPPATTTLNPLRLAALNPLRPAAARAVTTVSPLLLRSVDFTRAPAARLSARSVIGRSRASAAPEGPATHSSTSLPGAPAEGATGVLRAAFARALRLAESAEALEAGEESRASAPFATPEGSEAGTPGARFGAAILADATPDAKFGVASRADALGATLGAGLGSGSALVVRRVLGRGGSGTPTTAATRTPEERIRNSLRG